MKNVFAILFFVCSFTSYGREIVLVGRSHDTLKISNDIYLLKLSETTFIHVSWHSDDVWGKFTCNGMLVIKNGKAALFDTPMTDSLTRKLVYFIEDSLKAEIKYFVPNHFHADCTEGIDIIDSLGANIISSEKTKELSLINNIISAKKTFSDTLTIDLSGKKILLNYLGEAHSKDNIVVWIEDEHILFGGCMVRSLETKSKGNVADANEEQWPKTLKRVKKRYSNVLIVIPGHGDYGNIELLEHSIKLTKKKPTFRTSVKL